MCVFFFLLFTLSSFKTNISKPADKKKHWIGMEKHKTESQDLNSRVNFIAVSRNLRFLPMMLFFSEKIPLLLLFVARGRVDRSKRDRSFHQKVELLFLLRWHCLL